MYKRIKITRRILTATHVVAICAADDGQSTGCFYGASSLYIGKIQRYYYKPKREVDGLMI